ncbi:MAG: hypothetical protein ACXWPM_12270 [Bdellovibrionota bacterium]
MLGDGQFSGIFDALGFTLVAMLLLGFPFLALFYAAYQYLLHGGLVTQPTDQVNERLDETPVREEPSSESKAA